MKWLIASDIHGSWEFCEKLMAAYQREDADKLLLLGDLLYHGPRNDLPVGYAPKKVIELLNAMRENILCVRGNCDAEVDQMVLEFPIMADYAVIECGGKIIYATHGHHVNAENPPALQKGDILLCGHTHIPKMENCGEFIYMNPGSVSIPKEDSWRGYMTMEADASMEADAVAEQVMFRWKDLDGNIKMQGSY